MDQYAKNLEGKIKKIYYRKGEYPGYLYIESDDGSTTVPYKEYMTRLGYFFTPRGCLFCDDLFNEKADISIGDPWGLVDRKEALVISRNSKGKAIIDRIVDNGFIIKDRPLSKQEAINTQNYVFKKNRSKRALIYTSLGIYIHPLMKKELRIYQSDRIKFSDFLISLILLLNGMIFNSRFYSLASIFPYNILTRIANIVKAIYKKGNKK